MDDLTNAGAGKENEPAGTAERKKLAREFRSLFRRFHAAGIVPAPMVPEFDAEEFMPIGRARELRKIFHGWRDQLKGFVAAPEPEDGEPAPEAEPVKPPTPSASADPGEGGRAPAPPAGVDEAAEMRKALRSFRRDAVLARVVAEARALDPAKLIDALENLAEIDEDGALSLLDPVSGKRLPLDAPTLRRLMPGAVAPPPGVAGGSGGKQPAEFVPGAPRDIVERAKRSQGFYDAHRGEVDAELRRREREGR